MLTSIPKEVLSKITTPIKDPDEARYLVMKLEKACAALKDCIGLAAPQIGISKSVAVIRDPSSGVSINLVNPKIISAEDSFIHTGEGCMSSPGKRFNVPRFKNIKIENYSPWPMEDSIPNGYDVWTTTGGRLVRQENCFVYSQEPESWGGIITIAVQHEIDHLSGICIPWKDGAEEILQNKHNLIYKTDDLKSEIKVGRNDMCPCGSGKKFKKCCLN